MENKHTISLRKLISEFSFEEIYMPEEEILISNPDVSRPGLALSGYFELFDETRIEVIGRVEHAYLSGLSGEVRKKIVDALLSRKPPALLVSTNLDIFPELLDSARANNVPLLRTKERTSSILAALIASLNVHLAPRITRHGVLIEVYGEGLLLLGDSGVGKSETAIELIKRGHRLIADDAVEIRRVSAKTLVGQAPEIIRHYVELRGIGIVDIRRLFGMGAIKNTERIDLVIKLEPWVQGKMYDRLGLDEETVDILGIKIPAITIPVRPGRNLAIILEIAAMNYRQKKMGYNTAEEFNKKLMAQMGISE
ncbi:MAG: HPr(Ser) kinase/phosphatase [Ruminococcaceae bacterium]|nr:HPr(Ser) kinase/phosphatase [Oscillospiraceae bacterium]MBQ1259088.1 HPr(Ser) kinase/phosphatase [Clostridia bacterium]